MGRWRSVCAVACAALLNGVIHAQDSFKIIVNSANPVSSISRAQASTFFLEKANWEDGQQVTAVDLPPASPTREAFSNEVLGLPVAGVIQRWRRSSAGQRVEPPPAVATDREVLAYVRLKPGAIGYVSASTPTEGVKVIAIGRAEATTTSQLVEVGGAIPMPERIVHYPPIYPLVAKLSRVQGDVDVEIVIGTTGSVESVRVVRSITALDDAAVAAVRRWKYEPTAINGVPVRVKAQVRVSFVL